MDDYLRSDAPVIEALDRAWDRSRLSVAHPASRVLRSRAFLLVQCAVAAGVAWWLATDVARPRRRRSSRPIVAVVCLGMSYGQRQRRVLRGRHRGRRRGLRRGRLRAGGRQRPVADRGGRARLDGRRVAARRRPGARHAVGRAGHRHRGAWPPPRGRRFTRWTDALIGGAVALVAATVVPQAPLRRPRVAAAEAVRKISELLRGAEASADDVDVDRAGRGARLGPRHGVAAARAEQRGRRGAVGATRAHRSSGGTRRTCARWSSSSSRSTGPCAAPGCSCAGSPCRRAAASHCRPGLPRADRSSSPTRSTSSLGALAENASPEIGRSGLLAVAESTGQAAAHREPLDGDRARTDPLGRRRPAPGHWSRRRRRRSPRPAGAAPRLALSRSTLRRGALSPERPLASVKGTFHRWRGGRCPSTWALRRTGVISCGPTVQLLHAGVTLVGEVVGGHGLVRALRRLGGPQHERADGRHDDVDRERRHRDVAHLADDGDVGHRAAEVRLRSRG